MDPTTMMSCGAATLCGLVVVSVVVMMMQQTPQVGYGMSAPEKYDHILEPLSNTIVAEIRGKTVAQAIAQLRKTRTNIRIVQITAPYDADTLFKANRGYTLAIHGRSNDMANVVELGYDAFWVSNMATPPK